MNLMSLVPLVGVGGAVGYWMWSRKAVQAGQADTSYGVASNVARRLGLTIQKGNPELHLMYASPEERNAIGMVGHPYGRKAALSELSWGTSGFLGNAGGASLSLWVQVDRALPDFEVTLRKQSMYTRAERMLDVGTDYPEVPTGDPAVDTEFRVVTNDPKIAPLLAAPLRLLAGQQFVHLFHTAQAQGVVHSIADGTGLPYVLQAAEEHLLALETFACAVEGRPAPARLVVA